MRNLKNTTWPIAVAGLLLVLGTSTGVNAAFNVAAVPQIDPTAGMAVATLLAGAVLVVRGRRRK